MEDDLALKHQLLAHCREVTDQRITNLTSSLTDIKAARDGETKSSAGDKFETGRAMMQLEEAKLGGQLQEALKVRDIIDRIKPAITTERIAAGSLVATNRGNYLLAIGLGKVRLNDRVFFCTSLDSPIGRELHGKVTGESFEFNELEFEVRGFV